VNVLFVSAEVAPLAKTGGLGDVAGALPAALRRLGHDVRIAMPRYSHLDLSRYNVSYLPHPIAVPMGYGRTFPAFASGCAFSGGTPLYFIGNDQFFNRGQIYGYHDDDGRFNFFSRACLELARMIDWRPDVIHCNDWHTALIPNFLKTLYWYDPFWGPTATVLTIHNLAYQGIAGWGALEFAGLAREGFITTIAAEHDSHLNMMARGILFAEAVNAVSPRYAREILTRAYGEGLDPLLWINQDKLFGIVNGVDYDEWNPEIDGAIAARYGVASLDAKGANKEALQREMGLAVSPRAPLLGFVSRLVDQKGVDLIVSTMDALLRDFPVQFVALCSGDNRYEHWLWNLAQRHPGRVSVRLKFDAGLSRRIYAGADMFLMPSKFEPCGISQLISMRYGTIPIVRRTGGLADTVQGFNPDDNSGTGFVFDSYDGYGLYWAVQQAVKCYLEFPDSWRALQQHAMSRDFSWERSARQYVDMYNFARERRRHHAIGRRYP